MINLGFVKKCCKDYTLIANYEEAMNDKTQTWICHHILGEILTLEQLIEHNFYYDVPPCMLKFVTKSEHRCIHNKGKHHSDETRQKLSESHKGKHHSEEHRKKISEAMKNISDETRKKISEAKKGKTLSDETKRKMSEARKGRTAPNKGKKASDETRRKMREAWVRRKAAKEK